MAIFTNSDPCGNGESDLSEPPGDNNDLDILPVTPQTPPTSQTEDNRQFMPDEDRTEDNCPLTPVPDLEPNEDEDSRPLTPLQDLEPDEDRISAIQPVHKKRYGKRKDNGTGDQDEVGDATQPRAAKRHKTTTPAKTQAKPKPKPKVSLCGISD